MAYPYDASTTTAIARLAAANSNAYDAGTNPNGLARGGHRQNFAPDLNALATVANSVSDAANAASNLAANMAGTSVSSVTIGTGSKSFTTQAGKFFDVGRWLQIVYDANNYLIGQVTSYSGTALVVNVTKTGGSGTYASWNLYVSSTPGADGATGATGSTGATGRNAGIPLTYDGSAYTQADPGTGKLRRNNATPALVTRLYISETDTDGKGASSWWSAVSSGTSTKRGRIDIFHATQPQNFLSFDVTGALSDQGGWDILTVSYRDSGGTLSNGDPLLVWTVDGADKGDQGIQGIQGTAGTNGMNGATGATGPTTTNEFVWDPSTVDSYPGNGKVKVNSSTYSSITKVWIDNLDRYSGSVTAWVDSMDDSTNTGDRGSLYFNNVNSPGTWLRLKVNGVIVDKTGYREIPVAYIGSNGTFATSDGIALAFARSGDKGNDGAGAGNVNTTGSVTAGHFVTYADGTGNAIQDGGAFTAATIPNVAAGNISSNNVQAALNELDTEKAPLASPSFTGTVDITQAILFSGVISPTQITSDQDNYAPTGFATCSVMRLTVDAARAITGLAGGSAGRFVYLFNADASNNITLKHDTTSTSANRFYCPNSVDLVLMPRTGVWLWYDTTSSRWRVSSAHSAQSIYAGAQGALVAGTVSSQLGALDTAVTGKAGNGFVTFSGPTSTLKTFTLPNANETIACLGQIQTWTGAQSFADGKLIVNGATSGTTTLKASETASGTITFPAVTDTVAVLGTAQAFTASQTFLNSSGIKIKDTDASNTLGIVGGSNLTSDRTLTLTTGDANRNITLGGDLSTAGAVTFTGAYSLTLTLTGATSLTLPPVTGTVATLTQALMPLHAACGGL